MENIFDKFHKKKDFLVCVDSDGCAIDTMTIKHTKCFGPCVVEEWDLGEFESEILESWNRANLYTMTRGINRFEGLAKSLLEVNEKYTKIHGVEKLKKWVEESNELSINSLKLKSESDDSIIFKKAISWSNAVNDKIRALTSDEKKAFEKVKEGLEYASKYADIAIVSSANLNAVEEEWQEAGLLKYVDILLAQEAGTKSICIENLLKKGYNKDKVVMVGDAQGDYKAASKNGVLYFPILVNKEKESWEEFVDTALDSIVNLEYRSNYQDTKLKEFIDNLS